LIEAFRNDELYTSLIRDIMSEVKQQVKEEVLKELKNHDVD